MNTVLKLVQFLEFCSVRFWCLYRVPTGQGKLEKVREFEWSGKDIFLEKSGKMKNWYHQMSSFKAKSLNARNLILAGALLQTPAGELTALVQTP